MALKTARPERANLGVRPVRIGLLTSSVVRCLICASCAAMDIVTSYRSIRTNVGTCHFLGSGLSLGNRGVTERCLHDRLAVSLERK